jgi:hypothetical protein
LKRSVTQERQDPGPSTQARDEARLSLGMTNITQDELAGGQLSTACIRC